MPPMAATFLALWPHCSSHVHRYTWKTLPCGIKSWFINRLSIACNFARLIACSGHGSHASGQIGARP
jgi:hypothetical protein